MIFKELKELVNKYMLKHNLNTIDFYKRAGISQTAMGNLMNKNKVSLPILMKIADTVGYEVVLRSKNEPVNEEFDKTIDIEFVNKHFIKINGKIMMKSYFDGKWREEGSKLTNREIDFFREFIKVNNL